MRRTSLAFLSALTLSAAVLPMVGSASAAPVSTRTLRVSVLSNRADLISGGDALVRIALPRSVPVGAVSPASSTLSWSYSVRCARCSWKLLSTSA